MKIHGLIRPGKVHAIKSDSAVDLSYYSDKSKWSDNYKQARKIRSSAKWQKIRDAKMRINPLCQICAKAAREVHHIDRVSDTPELAYNFDNLLSLCERCHDSVDQLKTTGIDVRSILKIKNGD